MAILLCNWSALTKNNAIQCNALAHIAITILSRAIAVIPQNGAIPIPWRPERNCRSPIGQKYTSQKRTAQRTHRNDHPEPCNCSPIGRQWPNGQLAAGGKNQLRLLGKNIHFSAVLHGGIFGQYSEAKERVGQVTTKYAFPHLGRVTKGEQTLGGQSPSKSTSTQD